MKPTTGTRPALLMISGDASAADGVEGSFHQTLRELSRHWERIDVICPPVRTGRTTRPFPNVEFHPAPAGWLRPLHIAWRGRSLIARHGHALAASHDYGFQVNGIGSWLLRRLTGIPMISEIHHIEGHPIATGPKDRAMRLITALYLRLAWRGLAGIRLVNRGDALDFVRGLGIPDSRILHLPSCYLDFSVFRPEAVAKKYDLAFCGRLVANKGLPTLLEAVRQLKARRPGVTLLIKGTGPLERSLRRSVARMGLTANVTFVGWVETARDTARLYNESRILVCASSCEGGPRVTLEAMACGIPVISTPVGVMKELLEGGNGLLFGWDARELAHKAELLLSDDALRQAMAERGRTAVQRFEYQAVLSAYAEGYLRLVPGHVGAKGRQETVIAG
jgi:glycosyltransferase involved in cell wall biosynthesis